MAQWKLTDYSTGSAVELVFPINPKEFTPPNRKATVKNEQTVATSGSTVMFMGRDQVPSLSFQGSIRTQAFYEDMVEWTNKWYPMDLTDDQGNVWAVLITSFSPKRIRKANIQWLFSYTIEANVVE